MMNMRTSLCITWKEMRVEMFISPALEARVILKMKIIFFKFLNAHDGILSCTDIALQRKDPLTRHAHLSGGKGHF